MDYTVYQLLWLFLFYSFLGWLAETVLAALKRRRLLNRGFLSAPFSPTYGLGALLFAIFLPELREDPFFLFLLGMILATFLEFVTGVFLERIFHQKWWDYSGHRFSARGYICLPASLFWGICAVLCIRLFDPLLVKLIYMLPQRAGRLILTAVLIAAFLDGLGSSAAVLQMNYFLGRAAFEVSGRLYGLSSFLENALTERIRRRMVKAYPSLKERKRAENGGIDEKTAVFARGCCFYKLAMLFFIGAFLGDITETIFCYTRTGIIMSRSSVVYGPFSIVWGLGCVLLTAFLYPYREKNDRYIFLAGTILGGAYEYICSVFSELVFGTVFWDYSAIPFNLGGRINLLYCFFWGIVAVVWLKMLYPILSGWIEKLPVKCGKLLSNSLILFMVFDMALSGLALGRYSARQDEKTAVSQTVSGEEGGLNGWLDRHFPDERMKRIYPNAKFVD